MHKEMCNYLNISSTLFSINVIDQVSFILVFPLVIYYLYQIMFSVTG